MQSGSGLARGLVVVALVPAGLGACVGRTSLDWPGGVPTDGRAGDTQVIGSDDVAGDPRHGDPLVGDSTAGDGGSGDALPGDGGDVAPADAMPADFAVTVTATGVGSGVVSVNLNGGVRDIVFFADGVGTFSLRLPPAATYAVTVYNVSAPLACAVSNGSGTITDHDITDVTVQCQTVDLFRIYPAAGYWLTLYKNDGADIFHASGALCDPATTGARGYDECLHLGQILKVILPGETTCSDLTATDSLGVFVWRCNEIAGEVRMVAVGLQPGRGLADVLDPVGPYFKLVSAVVSRGVDVIARTASMSGLWADPIVGLTAAGGDLLTAGTIYVVRNNLTVTSTVNFTQPRQALVVLPGVTLIDGVAGPADFVHANLVDMLWIEGRYSVGVGERLMFWYPHFLTARNVELAMNGVAGTGFDLCGASHSSVDGLRGANSGLSLLTLNGGDNNRFRRLELADSVDAPIMLGTVCGPTMNNQFEDLLLSNTAAWGFAGGSGSSDNRVINLTVIGAGGGLAADDHDVVINATTINTYGAGFTVADVGGTSLMNLLALNDGRGWGEAGLWVQTSADSTIVNAGLSLNATGVYFDTSDRNYFTGLLEISGNEAASCTVTGPGVPGLAAVSCAKTGPSDTTLVSTADFSGAIWAKVVDNTNPQGGLGSPVYGTITDWLTFERWGRAWGLDGSAFPNVDNERRCAPGQQCRIWDATLQVTDAAARNVLAHPTGNDVVTHVWSAATQPDCLKIPGATWSTNVCNHPGYTTQSACEGIPGGDWVTAKCVSRFLRNAVELSDDLVGNDNGLCESNETCLFTPNLGSYQGHGLLGGAGDFLNGVLTNIQLVRYATNGY